MAKLYGQNASVDFHADKLMSFGKSFSRLNGQPLDKSEVWYNDLQALKDYAKTDAAYVGQRVVYINTSTNTVANYCIQTDGSVKEIGTSPIGDEKSIVVAADGTVSLKGVAGLAFTEKNSEGEDVEVKYQPLMTSAGLTWVKPSATTVEGLAAEIEALKKDATDIKADITALEDTVGDSTKGLVKDVADNASGITAINTKIGTVAEGKTVVEMIEDAQEAATYDDTQVKADIKKNADAITLLNNGATVEGSVDYKIAQAVAAIMENPDDTMNSINELVTWVNDHAEDALELSNKVSTNEQDILALEGLVGETAVATQISDAIAAALKIEGVDKYALAADLTAAIGRIAANELKLKDIEEGAQKNKIETVDTTQFQIDDNRNLTLLAIAQSKVTGLSGALNAKVDKETGKRLMTDEEGTKLEGIEAGAQENYVKTVDNTQFKVDDTGNLTLLNIAMGKVDGLADALLGKVDKAEGYRMIDSDEAAKLEKLVLNEDGSVEVSGTVAAGNIDGLESWITNRAATLEGLSENNFNDTLLAKLNGIAEGAQVNVLEGVKLGDTLLTVANKQVTIPVGAGLKASTEVTFAADGTVGIGSVSVAKLANDANTVLVLDGGDSL